MANFKEKAVFIWNDQTIGDAAKITQLLTEAGFEAAYLHSTNPGNWRTESRVALARALKAAGLAVYASVAVYGQNPSGDGHQVAAIVNQYGLDGAVFDVESGEYETAGDAPARARALFTAYQQMTSKPSAFCGWPFYKSPATGSQYHPIGVLTEAMKLADVGMPMAYPDWGDAPTAVVRYLEATWKQWREYTGKPLVMAGRAYRDQYGWPTAAAVLAYDARARALGAAGMSWWVMELALDASRVPGVWGALAQTPKFNSDAPIPEPEVSMYKDNAIGLVTDKANWVNPNFNCIAGVAGESWYAPNPDLKAIELKAAGEGGGKPFVAVFRFSVDFYIRNQVPMDEALWTPPEKDEQFQMFVRAILNRNVKGVVVQVTNAKDHDGKVQAPNYFSFAAKIFCERAEDWVRKNKGVPFFIGTSNAFIQQYAPEMNNWAHKFNSWIIQDAITPLDMSYPQATDKPAQISTRPTWEVWQYLKSPMLFLYNGSPAEMNAFLGFGAAPDTTPPGAPVNLSAMVDDGDVTLTWQAPEGASGYRVYQNGASVMYTGNTSAVFVGVSDGEYTFAVSAYDLAGNESAKAEAHVVVESYDEAEYAELLALARENNALLKEILQKINAIFK